MLNRGKIVATGPENNHAGRVRNNHAGDEVRGIHDLRAAKPRLKTGCPGKSCASVCHRARVEEPMHSTPPRGGGFVASDCLNAAMGFYHLAKLWLVSAPIADHDSKTKWKRPVIKTCLASCLRD